LLKGKIFKTEIKIVPLVNFLLAELLQTSWHTFSKTLGQLNHS